MVKRTELGLKNRDFCDGFRNVDDVGELAVAENWYPWWQEGGQPEGVADPDEPGYLWRPEFRGEDAQRHGYRRIRVGEYSQKVANTFATHNAGLTQQVSDVPVGQWVTFSCWVQVWSSNRDNPDVSEVNGRYRTCVGIDPHGGTDPMSTDVVWGEMGETYDAWAKRSVGIESVSDTVTVFLRGTAQWRVKHNDAYWDEARLVSQPLVQPEADYLLLPPGASAEWYQAAIPYLVEFGITAGQRWNDAALLRGTTVAVNPSEQTLSTLQALEVEVEVISAATPAELAGALATRIADGHHREVPPPSEQDYVLLPSDAGPEWYRALLPYLLRFGPSSGRSVEAALSHPGFVTLINPDDSMLEALQGADSLHYDVVRADSPGRLAVLLQKRIDAGRRLKA